MRKQLYGQALGENGFPTGGRTCDEDNAYGLTWIGEIDAGSDLFSDVGDVLLMQGFGYQDDLMNSPGKDGIIELLRGNGFKVEQM